jgi:hypothetical protein
MRTLGRIALAGLLATAGFASIAQAQTPSAGGGTPPSSVTPPIVAPQAIELLKQMAAYVGSAEQFTFHADVTFDHVLPSGQKLQFAATEDVALQRPNGLYVEWSGDLGDRQFWYDGNTVTLYDPATPFYASEPAPSDIDAMLNQLLPQLDFSPPLADFLYRDPYGSGRGNIQFGFYLGLNAVGARSCHTLAFVEKDIDWQIWIDAGPQLIPCKLVITYKTMPAQPQFTAVFSGWDFAPRIATLVFTPTLPPDAKKIQFEKVATAR